MTLKTNKNFLCKQTFLFIFMVSSIYMFIPPATYADNELIPSGWLKRTTPHFIFIYHPKTEGFLKPTIDSSETELNKMVNFFDLDTREIKPIEVRIARNAEEMKKIKPGEPPFEWATGIAMRGTRMIIMSLVPPGGGPMVEPEELFLHELAHILTYDSARRIDLPIWFNEGLAINLSGEFQFERIKTLLGAAFTGNLLPLSQLDRYYPAHGREVNIAYAQSADLVRFLSTKYEERGKKVIPEIFKRLRRGDEFESALQSVCKRSIKQIEGEWLSSLNTQYTIIPALTGSGALWGVITGLVILAYITRKRRAKAKLKRMELEEVFMQGGGAVRLHDEIIGNNIPKKSEDSKKVFYDGRFHTLH